VFTVATDDQSKAEVDKSINDAILHIDDAVKYVLNSEKDVAESHTIFEIEPEDDHTTYKIRFTSMMTMKKLLDSADIQQAGTILRIYETIKHKPYWETVAGNIFEEQLHKLFYGDLKVRLRLKPLFEETATKNMSNEEKEKLADRVSKRRSGGTFFLDPEEIGYIDFYVCGSNDEFVNRVGDCVKKGAPFYVRPISTVRNYEGVDAFLCIPATGKVYIIHIARSASRAITVSGLKRVQSYFNWNAHWDEKDREKMKSLRPTVENPWEIVLLVPDEVRESYTYNQKLTEDKRGKKRKLDSDNVPQEGDDDEYWETKTIQVVCGVETKEALKPRKSLKNKA
jgi:hypothetical protein